MNTKICTKCGEPLPATPEFFRRDRRRTDGLRAECKKCSYKQDRVWVENNREHVSEYQGQYREKNKPRILEQQAGYREENREPRAEYFRRRYREDPEPAKERSRTWEHCTKAREAGLEHSFSTEEWAECVAYFGGRCAYCGEETTLQREHFVPLSKGGGYVASNILSVCSGCNSSKRTQDFDDWYPAQEFFSAEREARIREYLGAHTNENDNP